MTVMPLPGHPKHIHSFVFCAVQMDLVFNISEISEETRIDHANMYKVGHKNKSMRYFSFSSIPPHSFFLHVQQLLIKAPEELHPDLYFD